MKIVARLPYQEQDCALVQQYSFQKKRVTTVQKRAREPLCFSAAYCHYENCIEAFAPLLFCSVSADPKSRTTAEKVFFLAMRKRKRMVSEI